jgi:hypothetical protein
VADGDSYFSRFTVKFIEISAAGVATAVSGFVLAHLAGYMGAPAPVVMQPPAVVQAPLMTAPAPVALQPAPAQSSQTTSVRPAPSTAATNPQAAPVAARAEAPRSTSQPDGNSATATLPPLRATVNAAPAEPARKPVKIEQAKTEPVKTEPSAAEAKLEAKPDAKPDSIEAQVRAALANADAHRTAASPDTHPPDAHPMIAPPPAAASIQPRSPENPVMRDAVATPPRSADIAPQPLAPQTLPRNSIQQAPVQQVSASQAPLQIAPAPPVEIKSQPVAGVDASASAAPVQAEAKNEDKHENPFSAFSKFLRTDTSRPPSPNDIPRPPMPVGQ